MTSYTYSVASVLRTISDDYALALFNAVAMGNHNVDSLKATSNLSTKQYYSRMAALSKSYLIRKNGGKVSLTSLGKLVYDAQLIIQKGLHDLTRLKVIDSIEIAGDLSKDETDSIISMLLDNNDIKTILEKH